MVKIEILKTLIHNVVKNSAKQIVMPGDEIRFSPRQRQDIYINANETEVQINLNALNEDEEEFKLIEGKDFTRKELERIAQQIDAPTKSHPYAPELLAVAFNSMNSEFGLAAYAIVKRSKIHSYMVILAKRGTTEFEHDIVYFHGGYEVRFQ